MTSESGSAPIHVGDELAARKLAAFGRIEQEFIASFLFVQDVHGQRRFDTFPLADVVRYLLALALCERKDRLLSVLKNIERYDGARCLRLLRGWQQGETAAVVDFIHTKLDNQPFAEVSRQIEQAARTGDARMAHRLASGRIVLLNRNFNLSHALDAIFALEPEPLRAEVCALCERASATPEELTAQLAELESDLYAYAPSAALARRNMLVMNRLGMRMGNASGERPGERSWRVVASITPEPPWAEEAIPGEMTLTSLSWHGGPVPAPLAHDPTPAPTTSAPGAGEI